MTGQRTAGHPVAGRRTIVVGDLIDDIVVAPSGPIRPDTDTTSTITRHPGGSASNTAAWLAWLGAPVDLIACVGAADRARHDAVLRTSGVSPLLQESAEAPTGTIVIIIEGESRSMLTDRGANAYLDTTAVTDALLADAATLHLTGYSLFDAIAPEAFVELVARAHARDVEVSFDPGSVGFIADFGVDRFRSVIAGVDLLLPTLDEGRLLTGLHGPYEVAEKLLELAPAAILTHGAAEVLVARAGEPTVAVPVQRRETVDPTGAGDAFTAGVLAARASGADLVSAARTGIEAAGLAVGHRGGRPPAEPR